METTPSSRAKALLFAVGILAGTLALTASLWARGSLSLRADVSEAAPVVHVWGMLPEGSKHEYLGTYEQFDLDAAADLPAVVDVLKAAWFNMDDRDYRLEWMRTHEIAGEHIYIKQGSPYMAMWRAYGGEWWSVGHLAQALGHPGQSNDAVLSTYSSAVVPEHIHSPWYAKTDGEKWLDAPGLRVKAGPVGAEALLGAPAVHLGPLPMLYDVRLVGTYHRRDNNLFNDHAVYVKPFAGCNASEMAVMWYSSKGWWKVGYTKDGTIGNDEDASIAAYDQAVVPEGVTSQWYATWDFEGSPVRLDLLRILVDIPDDLSTWFAVQALHVNADPLHSGEALQGSSVVHLSGSLPTGAAHEWLGTYDRRGGDLVNEHAVFIHRGDSTKAMWSSGGHWVLTNITTVGNCGGHPWWGDFESPVMVPEKISVEASRHVNVSGKLLYAPALRIDAGEAGAAALRGAPSVYLSGEVPVNADHSYFGTYDRRGDDLVNDHAIYVMRSDPDKAMWYSRFGRWMVGPASSLGSTAGIFAAYDPADTPERVNTTWKALIKDEWIEAAGLKTGVTVVLKWRKILKSHVCGKKKKSFSYTVGRANVSTMEFEQHSQQGDHSWNLHAHGMLEGLAQLTPLLPLVAGVARAGQATGAASGFASSFADLPEKTEAEASIDFKVKDWALEQKAHQMVSRTESWEKTEASQIEGDAWFQDGVLTVMCRFEKQLQASMNTGMATWNMGLPFTQQCFYTMSEGKQSKCSCSSAAAGIAGTECY